MFIFALAAKVVFIYGSQHPAKHDLLPVNGIVNEVRLGGHGKSTSFRILSDRGTHRYSSYYGKVWPGTRRKTILIIIAVAVIGSLFILVFENHSDSLLDWFISDSSQLVPRLRLLFAIFSIFGAVPLIAFAVHLWFLGDRVTGARRFPYVIFTEYLTHKEPLELITQLETGILSVQFLGVRYSKLPSLANLANLFITPHHIKGILTKKHNAIIPRNMCHMETNLLYLFSYSTEEIALFSSIFNISWDSRKINNIDPATKCTFNLKLNIFKLLITSAMITPSPNQAKNPAINRDILYSSCILTIGTQHITMSEHHL